VGAHQFSGKDLSPMHRQEHDALSDAVRNTGAHARLSPLVLYSDNVAFLDSPGGRIVGVDLKEWSVYVLSELIHLPCFCHRMPLIADATCGHYQRIIRIGIRRDIPGSWR